MRVFKIILTILLTIFTVSLLCFAGFFLWNAIPRASTGPDVLQTDQIFEPDPDTQAQPEPDPEPEPIEKPDPEPEPVEEPDLEPEPIEEPVDTTVSAQAQAYLETMTQDEKIWQLFFVTPEAITGVTQATVAGETTRNALAQMPVGGICYFAGNLENTQQVQQLLSGTQSYAKTPLFLGVDEEGGVVSRAGANDEIDVTHFESAQTYGRKADVAEVYNVGKTLAQQLGALGFNVDFAPVADVVTNSNNTEIGTRSYSSDPQVAAPLVGAMVEGLQRNGMLSCLKHFPGHGSTETNSHLDKSISTRTLDELRETEWLPFQTGIDKGAAFVMISHLTNENISDKPSDLSSEVIGYLRDELGFTGIVITDSHQMGAITSYYDSGDAAVLALQAGVDMILMPADLQDAFDGVKAALANGTLTQARIDESVLRILSVKYQFGIMK